MHTNRTLATAGAKVEKGLNCLGAGYGSRTATTTAAAMLKADIMAMAQKEVKEEALELLKDENASVAFANLHVTLFIFSMTS